MSNLKAIPTEYKGIRFRSKSEAIFARAMDLAGIEAWEYEPATFDGYTPDFLVSAKVPAMILDDGHDLILSWLIEYKPSTPSSAYIEKFKSVRFPESIDHAFIFYGSPYSDNGSFGVIESRSPSRSEEAAMWVLFVTPVVNKMTEAMNYRFDLKEAV